MFKLAPFASGAPKITDKLELYPPPIGCAGGVSSEVPLIVTVQGGVSDEEEQVAASVMGPTLNKSEEVTARRSALPEIAGLVEIESIRNLNRVMGTPVLFVTLYLRSTDPCEPGNNGSVGL